LPTLVEGTPEPSYHLGPSAPAGPVGPGVPVFGVQAEPSQTSACPKAGAVAAIARPWSWVALPLVAEVVE
jgi:hypothetical protein